MTEELGKIEKPEASQYSEKRKLCLVTLVFKWPEAPADYAEKYSLYWQQVKEQIANLESKVGKVNRVYHEAITLGGEDGLKIIEKLNPSSCQITKELVQNGAEIVVIEDTDLCEETMDWERHMLIGFISPKVAKVISDHYDEVSKKKYEHMAKRIDETLKENEVGVLFIREGHRIQFSKDIEVFSIAPPSLDDIRRWNREHQHVE